MRKPRKKILANTGQYHKMWRGHNREPVLETDEDKKAYLGYLVDTYTDEIKESVAWWGYCLMTNHTHEPGAAKPDDDGCFEESIGVLGNWMRNAHSRFGQAYNKRNGRQGKVAYDRPKTTEIKDDDRDVLRTMFYIDANPVRAGLVRHPKTYRYSSHSFYAQGKKDEVTEHLTPPDAYLRLGKTAKTRQKKYAHLFAEYLRDEDLWDDIPTGEDAGAELSEETTSDGSLEEAEGVSARGDPYSDFF